IPTTKAESFFTVTPEQDTVEIKAFQGESPVAAENTPLGDFLLTGIPPSADPNKQREIIVEFSYNLDGIVEVAARDRRGERHERITVSTTAAARQASEPERKTHFAPALERDVARALEDAARLELDLATSRKTREVARLRKARHALEQAHAQADEK